jgi:hypothetical protein
MSSIYTEYPLWFIFLCLVLGFLYAFILYRKDKKFSETPGFIRKIMFGLRMTSVSFISFLLLSPVLKITGKIIEKPFIVYVQDNSKSVQSEKDLLKKTDLYMDAFFNERQKEYTYKKYSFGENLIPFSSEQFNAQVTDLNQVISELNTGFYRRNLAGVILASDGIYNTGSNPEYLSKEIGFPIYTIAIGDTSVKPDYKINTIVCNSTAYLNNYYPLQVSVTSTLYKNQKYILKIFDNGKQIAQKETLVKSDQDFIRLNFDLKADKIGFHKIKCEIVPGEGEINLKNNSKQVIVEVIDTKQKILVLADAPHPDISAIRQSLELNQNYETEFSTIEKFTKSVNTYQLVILHQLPSDDNSAAGILSQINTFEIPVLYILGNNSSLIKFDQLNTGLKTGGYSNKSDEVQGILNTGFDLFSVNPEIGEIAANAPPLLSPFGEYTTSAEAQILFYRKVKNIETKQALFMFNNGINGQKNAVIAGEGIWRWRLFDYKLNGNHFLFNELINKTIQYMTVREMKEQFKIIADRIVPETKIVEFKAETYDKNYRTIENSVIKLKIFDSNRNEYPYQFEKSGNYYKLSTQKFLEGDYTWKAETVIEGKKFTKEGVFSVVAFDIENDNTVANHNILYKLSKNSGGKLFYPDHIDELLKTIENDENIVPVAYTEKKSNRLINFKIIFIILTILLSGEWFLRKFHGGY